MPTRPARRPGDATSPEPQSRSPLRSHDEERVLTDFARNYLTGRRWLCRIAHVCAGLGAIIAAIAAGWDHVMAAADHLHRIISHSH